MTRKTLSYLLGALLFILLFAARPVQQGHPKDSSEVPVSASGSPDIQEAGNVHPAGEQGQEAVHGTGKKSFDPSHFIFDHILDSYEWHILTFRDFLTLWDTFRFLDFLALWDS